MKVDKEHFLLYIALSILHSRGDSGVAPELLYILSAEQLQTFIKVFGGQSIKIPDAGSFRYDLLTAIFAYFYATKGLGKVRFAREFSLQEADMQEIQNRFKLWWVGVTEDDLSMMRV